jgi:hypothetical protein
LTKAPGRDEWLTGDDTERVDTRALHVIYAVDEIDAQVYFGQQADVFIDADSANWSFASTLID